ncbi:MAG TPA: ABC transporter permease, partial [Candidatus Omnitrophota bacterium]|nr:ABC transporter permease [Candidatus Omnitrophota bacterium]
LQRIMRGNMLEVLRQQYILTARAKGLPESRVIYRHALRNAVNPLITLLGYEFANLLSGAALLEIICSWPGLGALMLTAVRSKDIYLVMASFMMGSVLFLLGNLLADILLARMDPRIRYE